MHMLCARQPGLTRPFALQTLSARGVEAPRPIRHCRQSPTPTNIRTLLLSRPLQAHIMTTTNLSPAISTRRRWPIRRRSALVSMATASTMVADITRYVHPALSPLRLSEKSMCFFFSLFLHLKNAVQQLTLLAAPVSAWPLSYPKRRGRAKSRGYVACHDA